jgi:hypothetical protein
MGYFVTLPDLKRLGLFQGGLRPYWLLQARDWSRATTLRRPIPTGWPPPIDSRRLLKSNQEAARRSALSGTSVWLFQDYLNCAEGVVDMFFDRSVPEEFRKYNAPTVLLLDAPSPQLAER